MTISIDNPITELDALAAKEQFKEFLKTQVRFKDYDFDGSNMSTLLDILAYNSQMNNFYTNMAFSEMFMDSAQLRNSVFSHSKDLNYLPRSYRAARAKIRVTLQGVDPLTPFVTIPAKTRFSGTRLGTSVAFYNENAVTVSPTNGIYYAEFEISEGTFVTDMFQVQPDMEDQEYLIASDRVDTSTVRVHVRPNLASTVRQEYNFVSSLYQLDPKDFIFMIEPHHTGLYRAVFGKNLIGYEPVPGNVIEVTYQVAAGTEANGVAAFSVPSIAGYNCVVETLQASFGGAEAETIESIKITAPKSIQIQNRAITSSDYEILLKTEFPEIEAVAVYGGEKESPPKFGTVVVVIDVSDADGLPNALKVKYERFLEQRCSIGVRPDVRSARFLYPVLDVNVYYDSRLSSANESDIRSMVMNAILGYSKDSLNDFGTPVRQSRLGSILDSLDKSIVSNQISISPSVDIVPTPYTPESFAINFDQKLLTNHQLNSATLASKYKPSIRSSEFTFRGGPSFIQDDGFGNLSIYSINSSDKFTLQARNVGSVNYETGRLTLDNLNVQAFSGNAIQITARPCSCDITPPRDRVVAIREKDVNITIGAENV